MINKIFQKIVETVENSINQEPTFVKEMKDDYQSQLFDEINQNNYGLPWPQTVNEATADNKNNP